MSTIGPSVWLSNVLWIHVDCDVLDDAVMPAVDYRLPGGLSWDELETVIQLAMETHAVVGVEGHDLQPGARQ